MMLNELATAVHEERLQRWGANRRHLAMREEALGAKAGKGSSALNAAFAHSGRSLAQVLREHTVGHRSERGIR